VTQLTFAIAKEPENY